jgi:hypothetical protein
MNMPVLIVTPVPEKKPVQMEKTAMTEAEKSTYPDLKLMADWAKVEIDACKPCLLTPVVQWYYDELTERGLTALASDLEKKVDDLSEEPDDILAFCEYLDDIKKQVSPEVRKRLEDFDYSIQSLDVDAMGEMEPGDSEE